jgi:hypothetical protein
MYQKPMNLYLNIPPLSAHPPSCIKVFITGKLRWYCLQNDTSHYQEILIKFIQQLTERGYDIKNLTLLLIQPATTLDANTTQNKIKNYDSNALFIRWKYHLNRVGKKVQYATYKENIKTCHWLWQNPTGCLSPKKSQRNNNQSSINTAT